MISIDGRFATTKKIVVNRHTFTGLEDTETAFVPGFRPRLNWGAYSASKTLAEFQNCIAGSRK